MATEKQTLANRANAKKSTGPKTEAGKQVSRRNALQHGLTSGAIGIGDEDVDAFEELKAGLERDYQLETTLEFALAELIAVDIIQLRRIPIFAAAYKDYFYKQAIGNERTERMWPSDPFSFRVDGDLDDTKTPSVREMATWLRSEEYHNVMAKLSRYQTTLVNKFHRHLQQLMSIVEMRRRQQRLVPDVTLLS